MSKKKAFSGNTMTLKDFHGGSIPTDLPLPSAPAVMVRPTDRSGFDRPTSWGYHIGRPDNRSRPSSSPATRHFDDKTPFLAHPGHIGRDFDEDERKPMDEIFTSRRAVNDDSFRVPFSVVELKPESVSTGRVLGWEGRGSFSQASSGAVNSYIGRVAEQKHMEVNSLNSVGCSVHVGSGSYPNAWMARKDVAAGVTEPVQSGWNGQSTVSKLAHASALEKVSSGRWQSKHSVQYHADVQVIQHPDTDSGLCPKSYDDNVYNRTDVMGGREFSDATLARGLIIEDSFQGGRKEELEHERNIYSMHLEVKERKPVYYAHRVQPARSNGNFGVPESQPPAHSEASERPKLKLLPRTKPLENPESNGANPKQGYQLLSESAHGHVEAVNGMHGSLNPTKPELPGTDGANHAVDSPKLNFKPRSQATEQPVGNIETERNALFGGARPRELVLRERGIDNVAINYHDSIQHSDRAKHNISKTERATEHATPAHQGERTENLPLDQRFGRKFDRKDHWVDVERADMQRQNGRNDNRRNIGGTEREQQQQQQKRHLSPETWRKPVEQPKPASADGVGPRYGKVASAVELAQAFSRSLLDRKLDGRYSGQRGLPGRSQLPFSRLMGPTSRAQTNGY